MNCVFGLSLGVLLCIISSGDAVTFGTGTFNFLSGPCPFGGEFVCTNSIPPTCSCTSPPSPPPPDPDCICFALFQPVCGRNGRQFSNSCEAGCANEPIACDQACPCPITVPSPSSPGNPLLFDFARCQDAGDKAAIAAASAACSTVKNKCPVRPPSLRLASSAAGFAAADSFRVPEVVRRLIERALAEFCKGLAVSTCKNNARSKVDDSDCNKLLSSGPAVSVPGCSSKEDANRIFTRTVNDLCQVDV